jgi:hypothetical protein
MPSFVFDVSTMGTNKTKNLYAEYVAQLNSTVIHSPGAPNEVLASIPAATALYYYVTAYDNTVFGNISIDANGLMKYDIVGTATDATFINIVFVAK